MSSSNLVKIVYIEETVIGETPVAGDFDTVRFISEALSGSPETTESQQIRTDRLSNGQVVTGLTVAGDIGFELSKEAPIDSFMESAMQSDFAAAIAMNEDFTTDNTAKTIVRAAGSYITDGVAVGDLLSFSGFASSVINAAQVFVTEVTSATSIKYSGTLVDEGPTTATVSIASKIGIGITKKSFSMMKEFEDLTDKAINYRGMMVNTMSLNVAYGEIVNGSFGFVGTDYEPVEVAANFMTDGRTVNASATTQSLNGSVDMPLIISDSAGVLDEIAFCIQSAEISLDNNSRPENCIGEAAPQDHNFGVSAVSVNLTAYLSDDNWNILAKKLTQESFSLAFQVKNADGYYAFFMPAVQVSFDDPSSEGPNQDVFLNMSGVAKVGDAGEKSLYIFKS
jgi:hypothetical protein